MDLYLIHLQGQGDTDIRLVRQDGWDALDTGHFTDAMKSDYEVSYECTWGPEEDSMVEELKEMDSGSAENDIALSLPPVVIDGVSAQFFSISEYTRFLQLHPTINIIAEYEGCIY